AHFLYLLARCVKAAVRYNVLGEFNQSPDNRRRGMQPDTMARNIQQVSRLLNYWVVFSAHDYCVILAAVQPGDFVYLDPPYQGVSGSRDRRYSSGIVVEEFIEVLDDLNTRGIAFMLSYDGRTDAKAFGTQLPDRLALTRLEIHAGRSTQATLLGRNSHTYESLYLSPALLAKTPTRPFSSR
ncbi:MAG: DNA adenine methylase, partial [Aggregatilineales bacterium]